MEVNPLLKGDRYSLPALPGFPPIEAPVVFDSDKAHDPDAHIEDPDEYLEAKRKRAAWLKDIDADQYMEQFRDPGDEQPEQ